MKNPIRSILLTAIALAFVVCLGCIATQASAQVAAAAPADITPAVAPAADSATTVANAAVSFLSAFLPAKAAGWLVTIATITGLIGLVTKPIMTAIEAYVKSTPSTTDDEFVEKVQHSRGYKVFAWLLDFLTRIKIGPQFTATPKEPGPLAS